MIHGTGVDMTTISRFADSHQRFGDRLARRILHAEELAQLARHSDPPRFLAKRFCIKEAAVKALGTGERSGVLLRDFYVVHDDLGKPLLRVSGEAQKRCEAYGIDRRHVSLSDEGDRVIAFVVLECHDTAPANR